MVDEKLGLGSDTFRKERKKFITKGKNLDEVFGLSSSSKYAPGYAEAVQLISPSVNKAKETQIDLPMSKILKTLDEGRTTMQYKGKKNVPIDKVVNDFNRTSAAFAKKNNIRGPKINLGGNFNLKNYINFRPQSQKNIEQVFKDKKYFLSEINNKPFETITSKSTNTKPKQTFVDRIKSGASNIKSKMDISRPVLSKIPGSAVALAPTDFMLTMLGGAPVLDAAASAGSYILKDPLLGKAVNVPLALREISNYNNAEEMLKKATERREGIESALKSVPSKFQSFIERNKGPADESFTSYFDGGIVSTLKGVK